LRNNHERRPAFIGRMSTADQPPRLYHVQLYSNDVTVKQREYVSRVLMFVADLSAA
jgi:ATP-dependent Clp protease adapter protein ClpS